MYNRHYVPSFHFDTTKPCYCGSMKRFGHCCASNSEERVHPSSIKIVNNFISAPECEQFISYADKQERKWLKVVDNERSTGSKRVMKRHPSRVTELVNLGKKQELVTQWMEKACREHLPSQANPQWFETPQMLRYDQGGKYGMHSDSDNYCPDAKRFYRFIDRDFSMLIYLNDGYVGGGLNFKGLNFSYQPKCGDLLIFPSNHVFTHESQPILSGTKYALVSWGAFKGSPRVSAPRQTINLH